MKPLQILLAMLVIGAAGVGARRGWFRVSSSDGENQANIAMSVGKDQVADTAQDFGHEAADKIEATPRTAPE